ncbi:MAG: sigma factor, partial [Oryzihumus sp.]
MHAREKAGRDAEFSAFMAEAGPSLLRTAWLLTGDADRAQELVQAALVKTYVAWRRVRPEDALAYARRVLVNHKTDVWRRARHEVASPELPESLAAEGSGPVDHRDEVVRLLRRLPEQQRRVVVMRWARGSRTTCARPWPARPHLSWHWTARRSSAGAVAPCARGVSCGPVSSPWPWPPSAWPAPSWRLPATP